MARVRNPRGHGAQLKGELLAAGDALLDETGDPAKVTVRGVAAAVGVSPNAVYLHFADRDALLAELAIVRFDECTAAVRQAVEGLTDPFDALLAGNAEYCRLALERPGHYRLLFHGVVHTDDEALSRRVMEAGGRYFQLCIEGCERCLREGVLDAPDARSLAAAVWAVQHGWCELALTGVGRRTLPDPRDTLEILLRASSPT